MSFGDSIVTAKFLAMEYDNMSDFSLGVCDGNVLKVQNSGKNINIYYFCVNEIKYCIVSLYCVYVPH